MSDEPEIIYYEITFTFNDGHQKTFQPQFNARTLALVCTATAPYPQWTTLTHCQCPNCPLNPIEHPHCPIAVNLIDLLDFFKDSTSYERVHVLLKTKTRAYQKETSMQEGVSALLGMLMVTSGCPIMDKLRPMLRAHIPFSTAKETTYRMLSMYLLAQYFRQKRHQPPDWDMKLFKKQSYDIQVLNKHFWRRFVSIKVNDASLNALVLLDNLAQFTAFSVDENMLSETELLFQAYFD